MKEPSLSKVKSSPQEVGEQINYWRKNNYTIVFTNGCFDILHSGHITYLREASTLGDKLIVGINSDHSVKLLKGEKRPIMPLNERLLLVGALDMVDMVIPFEEETPLTLIQHVIPNILVKGGDYEINEIVGAEFVLKNGGSVERLSFVDSKSTTDLIETILKRFTND